MSKLSHFDEAGDARMVDVSGKHTTHRSARAEAFVAMSPEVLDALEANPKGNPLEVARIAGIQAAKRTAELIPLCHSLPLSYADIRITQEAAGLRIESEVRTSAQTGVEMEALTACSVAALTVYDMTKALSKSITIERICLLEKTGGKSGDYLRVDVTG
jgi:cyclic pyranopterin monophosphate synthase